MISGSKIYFASEKDGTFNIWEYTIFNNELRKLTSHKGDGIRYPSISADKSTIVYEQGFSLWKLNLRTGISSKLDIQMNTVAGFIT